MLVGITIGILTLHFAFVMHSVLHWARQWAVLSYESTPEPNPEGLRLKICREVCGSWSVYGLSLLPAEQLPSLSDAIDYARQQCAAAPATIELLIGGFYAVIHQERGWPRRLLAREVDEKPPASFPTSLRAAPASSHLFGWLIGGAAHRH